MTPVQIIMVTVLLLAAPLAYGQDTQQANGPEATAAPPARVAIPRGQARTPDPARAAAPAPAPQRVPQRRPTPIAAPPPPAPAGAPAPVAAAAAPAEEGQRRAVPRGSRPRGDNPPTGVAVPRNTRRPPSSGGGVYRNGGVYRSGPRGYNNYNNFYVYPRSYYPYGYGGFGLGFFYYDPYRWFPGYYGGVYSAGGPYGYGGYYGGYYGGGGYSGYGGYGYDAGQLRLRVTPRHAEVYVDGYYAGTVDDYDGIAQALTLESGAYRIEIVAPGFEPLQVDVRITPGQKVTYRGDLRPRP